MSLKPQTAANCYHCKYEWWSRVKDPKACPRCKGRLDTQKKLERIGRLLSYCEMVGHISEETIKKYTEDQRL